MHSEPQTEAERAQTWAWMLEDVYSGRWRPQVEPHAYRNRAHSPGQASRDGMTALLQKSSAQWTSYNKA